MFAISIMSPDGKTLICKAKYPTEKQARYARFALVEIANHAHFAPVDSEINNSGAKFYPNQGWKIGNITKE